MKKYLALGTLLLASCTLLAQTTQSSQSSGQSKDKSGMKMGSDQKSQGMTQMHQHMQEMQADMQQMKTQVEKMRADAQKVQDANTKAALLDNADMWDQFVTRMQSHMQMMMQSGMHHGRMGMQHKKSQTAPSTPPAANPPQ